mmetsp:Transcript_15103/g.32728  ORF Transcript_15103/g.32728 Transcript_15103/m.32728 type:complete len:142 (-) Transcript_15103:601-1026(-)|eukprot:CAMPEP_0202894474 /NCGR_PEP_ID=MMETSP1392-20130828/3885_1 /ASSEMBLY_ACC=CAM_ASM_000868 /TAXON_ID=225041 /ORGANISM="Chlamydomonas chlamydogama, Strain SAG 11-48b" /LENGTH=141 /DNA_ID=CAMNT_0049579197 /DNA_START=56 /DNA_END=481 /DNA_ORIENTATION=-
MFGLLRRQAAIPLPVKAVEASSEKNDDSAAENVLSKDRDETWHSGRGAPGYIDLDLGAVQKVSHLNFLPYQVPTPAQTVHRIWVGETQDKMELVQEVKQETTHHKWVKDVTVERPARWVRIETTESPSWVAMSGVEVFGDT